MEARRDPPNDCTFLVSEIRLWRSNHHGFLSKARMSMSDNFALELFSGIGGMSLGLHSAGFESHGFDASERAVAKAN